MKKLLLSPISALIFFALTLPFSASAQVHRCTGPDGKVTYSDSRCDNTSQGKQVNTTANTFDASGLRRQTTEDARQANEDVRQAHQNPAANPMSRTAENLCPSDREIKNMEGNLSSILLRDKRKEREFLQAEIRRARSCSKEGGNYSADDWKKIKAAQSDQNRLRPEDRETARAIAEGIHASSASNAEKARMIADRKIKAEEEAEARREAQRRQDVPTTLTSCDKGGCWGSNGDRYNRAGGNTYIHSGGRACQLIGTQMQCN